jgi:hypothetical protein
MRAIRWVLAVMVALAAAPALRAQEKASGAAGNEATAPPVAYRVQVVLSEYDGATKVRSLPYTIPVAPMAGVPRTTGSLRVGLRVPISTTTKTGENTIQYMDVGTNADVRVERCDAERYWVELTMEHSWLYRRERNEQGKIEGRAWAPGDPAPESAPLNYHFKVDVEFLLRDGRSAETTVATDPLTGHVYKVDAQFTVLK